MGVRSRWCNECRASHTGECPKRKAWVKPVAAQSGRGGRRWRRLREEIFERDECFCRECLRNGVITVVTVSGSLAGICDHIIPLAEGGTDARRNLQTLCRACSDVKTAAESVRGRPTY